MKKSLRTLAIAFVAMVTAAHSMATDYPNYGMWNDQLSPAQAQGRFQWMEKCFEGLLLETWETMFDVTTPMSTEEKLNQLKDAWLYERGALRINPQYPTFGDKNHENPEQWYAGTSASENCKTIPRGYGMIGLLTSFDFKPYCPAKSAKSNYNAIINVTVGGFTNASGAEKYSNFSGRIIQVNRGDRVRMTMQEHQVHPRLKGTWHVFADWNRNGKLDDAGEILMRNTTAVADEVSMNLEVPENATPGYIKLRITDDYAGGSADPCRDIQYGEVEDYTLKIN